MAKLYEWIDRIWQQIAEIVFVRFEFDLPADRFRGILRGGRLTFALTSGGIIEWLILSSWCRRNGLDAILVSNRKRILLLSKPIYFFQVILRRKKFVDLFLSEQETGPRLLFCPSRERRKQPFDPTPVEGILGELYSQSAKNHAVSSFTIVPILILWRKFLRRDSRTLSEYFLGIGSRPSLIGKIWYLIRRRKDSTVRSLDEIQLMLKEKTESLENSDESESVRVAKNTRRRILVRVSQELRVVLGPRYLSTHSVKETLMKDPEFQKFLSEVAAREKLDRRKAMLLAYKNFTEIAANYRYRTIEVLYVFLTWLFTRVFDGVDIEDGEMHRIREIMKTKPVVFVSAHRSHFDSIVIPYVLFLHDMVTPHIATGINLKFWPLGPFLRSAGAFFIRRSFRGDVLYSMCFKKYVEYLLKSRIPIKFFIEGTRSRSGKMLPPAHGLLKTVLESVSRKMCEDVALVPVSICYDQVPEEGSYTKELSGEQKTKESAGSLLRSRKIIYKNMGRVYVRFAAPVSAREVHLRTERDKTDPTLALQKTAFQICKSINDASPVTPISLVATVLLGLRIPTVSLQDILGQAMMLARYARWSGLALSVTPEGALRRAMEHTIKRLYKSGVVGRAQDTVPQLYFCEEQRRIALNYYKNSAIHCFILPSIALLAFLSTLRALSGTKDTKGFQMSLHSRAVKLRNILKFEYFFSSTPRFLKEIDGNTGYFFGQTQGETCDTLNYVGGLGRLHAALLLLRILGDVFESYRTVIEFFRENGAPPAEKKGLVQRIIRFAEQEREKGEIIFPESISIQNYSNALLLLENLHLVELAKDQEKTWVSVVPWNAEFTSVQATLSEYLGLMEENMENFLSLHGFQVSKRVEVAE